MPPQSLRSLSESGQGNTRTGSVQDRSHASLRRPLTCSSGMNGICWLWCFCVSQMQEASGSITRPRSMMGGSLCTPRGEAIPMEHAVNNRCEWSSWSPVGRWCLCQPQPICSREKVFKHKITAFSECLLQSKAPSRGQHMKRKVSPWSAGISVLPPQALHRFLPCDLKKPPYTLWARAFSSVQIRGHQIKQISRSGPSTLSMAVGWGWVEGK